MFPSLLKYILLHSFLYILSQSFTTSISLGVVWPGEGDLGLWGVGGDGEGGLGNVVGGDGGLGGGGEGWRQITS